MTVENNATELFTSTKATGNESEIRSESDGRSYRSKLVSLIGDSFGSNTETIPRLSNWRTRCYHELFGAIVEMSELPSDHELNLDKATSRRAQQVLGFIKQNIDAEPPQIINQDGEAVSFTWDFGDLKRYLTVDASAVDLMLLSKKQRVRCEESMMDDGHIDLSRLMEELSSVPISRLR